MEEKSLLEFLQTEIHFFRELYSSLVAEEIAYQNAAYHKIQEINAFQKQVLEELKNLRPKKFQAFNMQNAVDKSLLHSLKGQLDSLIYKINDQFERNKYTKHFSPQPLQKEQPKKKPIVDTAPTTTTMWIGSSFPLNSKNSM